MHFNLIGKFMIIMRINRKIPIHICKYIYVYMGNKCIRKWILQKYFIKIKINYLLCDDNDDAAGGRKCIYTEINFGIVLAGDY